METFLILAAVTACVIVCVAVAALTLRSRRAPLRMDSEHDVEDEALLLAEIGRPRSPIDHSAPVLDLVPIEQPEPPRRAAGPAGGDAR